MANSHTGKNSTFMRAFVEIMQEEDHFLIKSSLKVIIDLPWNKMLIGTSRSVTSAINSD